MKERDVMKWSILYQLTRGVSQDLSMLDQCEPEEPVALKIKAEVEKKLESLRQLLNEGQQDAIKELKRLLQLAWVDKHVPAEDCQKLDDLVGEWASDKPKELI